MKETNEFAKIFENLEVGEKVVLREEEENTYIRKKNSMQLLSKKRIKTEMIHRESGGIRERQINREVVDMYKLGKVIPKIMKVMEDERLNIAEAEMIPELLEKRIKRNSELHEKAKQFTVHEKLLR